MIYRRWAVAAVAFTIVYLFISASGNIDEFVASVKDESSNRHAAAMDMQSEGRKLTAEERTQLMDAIQAEAAKQEEAPINAKVDRVWKAIPGYNGQRVNVEESYKLALRSNSAQTLPLVYEEIKPEISLDDLGAQPIYRGNPKKPMVSFMINVAWGNVFIDSILSTLDEENVHATFFLDGSWLSKNVEVAKKIQEHGHELSNHAYSHQMMSGLSRQKATEEIQKTETLLKDKLSVNNKWFAPPAGDYDQETVDIAYELGLKTVLWTVDTIDWRKPSPSWIVERIRSRIEPGAMVLMHPTEGSSQALRPMIRIIKEKGLGLGTVSELLSSERVELIEEIWPLVP